MNKNGPYRDLYISLIDGRVKDEDEPAFEEGFLGNWVEDESSFLFFSSPALDRVSAVVAKTPELNFVDEYHFSYEQWQGGGLEPFTIGDFLITPPWEDRPEAPGEIKILLDPGVVFGTGLHPTTKDCLRAMVLLRRRFDFERVLDIGTGTGLLAFICLRAGAKRVHAVERSPAIKWARQLAERHGWTDRITFHNEDSRDLDLPEKVNVVVSDPPCNDP